MALLYKMLRSPTLVVFQGLPASGKTTRAKQEVLAAPSSRVVRVNRDDLRWSLCVKPDYSLEQEELITAAQYAMLTALLRQNVIVISDDTNLRGMHVATLRAIAEEAGAGFHLVNGFLTVGLDECVRRDKARPPGQFVGEEVISRMWHRFTAEQVD